MQSMAEEIEQEIQRCEKDLRRVGSLVIKTHSLSNMLAKEDPELKEIKILKIKTNAFKSKVKELSERRAKEKQDLENEMEDSKIRVKRITEVSGDDLEHRESSFFSTQSSRLDDFISNSMDSLESLRRQNVFIDRINNNLREGAIRLGMSGSLLANIESRFAGDKSLFIILLLVFIFVVVILRFIF